MSLFGVSAMLSLMLLPVGTAVDAVAPTAAGAASAPAAPRASDEPVADVVLVDASLGGRHDLEGATVKAVDANGQVLQTVVSGDRGEAILSRELIATAVKVRVTRGVSEGGTENDATLWGPVRLNRNSISVVHVTPVTTLAEYVSRHREISYGKAMRAVRSHLKIPHWTSIRHHANDASMFGERAFRRLVRAEGGVRDALATLEQEMDSGAPAHPLKDRSRTVQTREGEIEIGLFLGESLFTAITGQDPGEFLGSLFGTESPTDAMLEEISKQLAEISQQLNVIEGQLNALANELKTAEFLTVRTEVAGVVNATAKEWDVYNALASTTKVTNFEPYARDFYLTLNPLVGQYNGLFTDTAGKGVIQALYDTYLAQYPWWGKGDVDKMRSVVDYYGAVQAQTLTLLMEAWRYQSDTYDFNQPEDYIDVQVASYWKPQHEKIYHAMPDAISDTEIVNPANQRAYSLSAAFNPPVGKYDARWTGKDATCASSKGSTDHISVVSASTVAGWWASETPTGYSSGTNAELAFLKTTRSVVAANGTSSSTNALAVVAPAAPGAWVALTNQALPSSMYDSTKSMYGIWGGWAYCGDASVSLLSNQLQAFAQSRVLGNISNGFMMTPSAYTPTGGTVSTSKTPPVSMLLARAGAWRYKITE